VLIKEFVTTPALERSIGKSFRFLSPNTWTTLSLFTGFFAFWLIIDKYIAFGTIVFLISTLMDMIDGKVARYTNRATPLGAFWDGTVDRVVDMLLILSFFFLDFPVRPLYLHIFLFLLLFFTLMPPFIVAYANHRLAVPDPTEKVIRRFAFRAEYIFLFLLVIGLNKYSINASFYILCAGFILMLATCIQATILVFVKSVNYKL
jgi:phosphatidylglycerophosphate synthase